MQRPMALEELGGSIIVAFPIRRPEMESDCWKSMPVDELWKLHQQVTDALNDQIAAQQAAFEGRLRKIELHPHWLSAQFRSAKKRDVF
jgi:hypothetical protein